MIKTDILIIGGGAAGLSAGQYGARAGRDVVIVEALMIGGQLAYIDSIENYPGIDKPISGFEIAEMLQKQAEKFGTKIVYDEFVSFEKKNDTFFVKLNEDEVEAKTLIWATGAKHRHIDIPGEEELNGRGVSYCGTCDGAFFKNQTIFIVGGGDTALTDALFLNKLSDDVTIVHRRNRFRAQQNLIDLIEKSSIKTIMEVKPIEILGEDNKVSAIVLEDVNTGEKTTHKTKAVFIFAGMLPQTQLLPKELLDNYGYVNTNQNMETSIPGFYAIGDVRDTPFRQVITAASDGAIAAHSASEYIDNISGNSY
ncbi:MAG: FAD-dependent oxidoreductase [Spirochaetaceae bacterium]|nr:FAD-dependent oxidoreductase [Spirochaetaceae bacterium]